MNFSENFQKNEKPSCYLRKKDYNKFLSIILFLSTGIALLLFSAGFLTQSGKVTFQSRRPWL